jgi:hypothetical protein
MRILRKFTPQYFSTLDGPIQAARLAYAKEER